MTAPTIASQFHSITVTPPPQGRVVIIWWHIGEISATFDGQHWHDRDGALLVGPILYWREAS